VLDQQRSRFRLVIRMPTRQQVTLGCVTSDKAPPIRLRSPIHTSASDKPSTLKIFSQLPVGEVVPSQSVLPIPIGIHLMDEYGPVFDDVVGQVPLYIASC
jgi:hypothetical protein